MGRVFLYNFSTRWKTRTDLCYGRLWNRDEHNISLISISYVSTTTKKINITWKKIYTWWHYCSGDQFFSFTGEEVQDLFRPETCRFEKLVVINLSYTTGLRDRLFLIIKHHNIMNYTTCSIVFWGDSNK